MYKNPLAKILIAVIFIISLVGCTKTSTDTSFETGWSHKCTLLCTNASTGQQEEIEREGKNSDFTTVCKETKLTCEAGRSAACVNTANWTNTNEPLYNNCTSTSFGACTAGCARN